jgi:hypothetical protein
LPGGHGIEEIRVWRGCRYRLDVRLVSKTGIEHHDPTNFRGSSSATMAWFGWTSQSVIRLPYSSHRCLRLPPHRGPRLRGAQPRLQGARLCRSRLRRLRCTAGRSGRPANAEAATRTRPSICWLRALISASSAFQRRARSRSAVLTPARTSRSGSPARRRKSSVSGPSRGQRLTRVRLVSITSSSRSGEGGANHDP